MSEIVGFHWIFCDLRLILELSRQSLTTFWAKITSDYRKSEILEIGFQKAWMNMSILSFVRGDLFYVNSRYTGRNIETKDHFENFKLEKLFQDK